MKPKNVTLDGKTILVTGAAGFIGSNLVLELLRTVSSVHIIGIDNMNDYYDVSIKEYRLKQIETLAKEMERQGQKNQGTPDSGMTPGTSETGASAWTFIQGSIADKALISDIFTKYQPAVVVNLAAQAGVRYSITNPDAYIEANLIGFYNILEACRHSYDGVEAQSGASSYHGVEHLVYASSSSVYGSNKKVPYSTEDKVDNPVSLYAATKKSNELMAHAYSKLYNIPSTGLRFFTVYGPAGRPDMAYFGFTDKLRAARDAGRPGEEDRRGRAAGAALRGLQHRQQPSGEPAGVCGYPAAGADRGGSTAGGLRLRGSQETGAHAAGGCARDLCRYHTAGGGFRLSSQYASAGGPAEVCPVVSGVLSEGLTISELFLQTENRLTGPSGGASLLLPGGSFSIIGNRVFSAAHLRKE